ncbi:MAG: VWA domain-containing protein, partial [Spirochaetaceae bacterium]
LRAFASDGEVFVRRVDAPPVVRVGETHEFAAVIFAADPTPADVVVLRDGSYFGEERVTLGSGDNVIAFQGRFDEPGIRRYTVRVDAPRDTILENNEATAVVSVTDESRVLYVAGDPSRPYLAALRAQGLRTTVVTPDGLPGDVPSLSAYDLVVLDNIPAYDLSIARMQSLERYVRDTGGGLIAIGGDRSFGAGGWFATPLERVLPLDMDTTSTMKIPSVSMLFVIDKSGSMGAIEVSGVTRLDLVKEAVVSALEIMNPFHRVGVIAFDADAEWTVPMTQAGERDAIVRDLIRLEPGGGTVLGPALREAIDALAVEETVTRHVIVLSDGLTSDGDLTPLVRELTERSITVSTVSVGASADRRLMRTIAEAGGGRSYHAGSAADVPRIFADETSIVGRNMVVEEVFVPSIASGGSILAGFDEVDIPPLRGFVLAYPKPAADVLLIGPGDNPILAAWRYGLGRSVAFTSDLRGRWAREWLDWDAFARFAGQMARWAQRRPESDGLRVAIELDPRATAAQASIKVEARTPRGAYRNNLDLSALVQPPADEPFTVLVDQVGPGAYQARFDLSGEGLYLVSVVDDATSSVRTSGIEVSYNQEYTRFDTDYALLERAAQVGGGQMLTNDQAPAVFSSSAGSLSYSDRAWRILLALALALLVTDIVARKLT